ncbi:MAG: MFS transporter [Methanobrevibacter sp.]|nr:MFS transporter [Methanobrevibacter sp.]MBR0372079.1 MFS transporter [Methanobrevibacter sp.]
MSNSNEKIFTSQFFLIFGALFFTSFVMYVLMSPITQYTTDMGASASVAGLASGIYVIGGLISLVYSGQALQKWGWRKTAYVFLGLHLVVCLLYFISNNIPMLLLVRFLHGIGMGAGGAAIITIATPILPAKRFGEAMGYFLTGTPLAVGIGPIVGNYLIENVSATSCFLVATVIAVLALVCIFFVNIKQPQTTDYDTKNQYSGIEKFIELKAIPISVVSALCSFGYVGIISFCGVYASELHLVDAFSLFFIIYSIILIIARPLGGKIQDKFGNWLVTIVPITLQAIGVFLIALYPSFVSVIICAVCTGVGFGTFYSIANAMVTKNAPEERHSYAIATYLLFTDIALGFGPAFLGLFATAGNYGNLFLVSAIITFLALPISIVVLKRME